MTTESISELASIIATNTAKVNEYLSSKNLPSPSFDVNAPSTSLIPPEAEDIEAARAAVIEATTKLHRLMLGPRDYLQSFTHDELISMQAISRFKIASTFPVDSEATFAQISSACGLNEPDVRRLLRHAMTKHIFREPRKGVVVHTAASRLLAEDAQILDWVAASSDELWQAAAQTVNAMVKYPGSQEPNETGFALANGTDKSIYELFSQYPQRAKRFGSAMSSFIQGTGYDLKHLSDNYPWSELGTATVVDVGGSHGFVATHLAPLYPSLTFIIQDLPPITADGPSHIPPSLHPRISFQAHDFLTPQPVRGADVFFFRWIFHNWSDKYCLRILRNLIPALKRGARVVVMDNVLPEPGSLALWPEERIRSMDLTMLELQNSRERDLDDWRALFAAADPRFVWKSAKQPRGSRLWILEVVWDGEGDGDGVGDGEGEGFKEGGREGNKGGEGDGERGSGGEVGRDVSGV